MMIISCALHPEYNGTKVPETDCKTCELLFVLICKDDRYVSGGPDLSVYCSGLGENGLRSACDNLLITRTGILFVTKKKETGLNKDEIVIPVCPYCESPPQIPAGGGTIVLTLCDSHKGKKLPPASSIIT